MILPLVRRIRSRLASLVTSIRHSSLARAALLTGVLTILCKVIGFAKELQVASRFGMGATLDSYLVAVVLPNLVSNVFAISFASSVVMQYVRNRHQVGEDGARERFQSSMFWGLLFVASVAVTGVLLGPALLPWLSPGFRPELQQATQHLQWLMLPYTILFGVSAIWSSVLSSRGRVAASALSPGLVSLGVIVSLTIWSKAEAYILIAGLTLGAVIDVSLLGYCLRLEKLPVLPRLSHWHADDRWIVGQTTPLIIASALRFSSIMIDQSMASTLGEGSVSELNYGSRWIAMVQGLISLPLGKIIFPHFVQLVETRRWAEVQSLLRRSVLVLLAISVPITIALAGFSEPLVRWTFRRGQFTSDMATRVAAIQVMYALQFPFFLWSALLGRLAIAMQMRRVILGCGILNVLMNISMNYWLMKPLGVTGIALSTAIVYLSAACYFSTAITVALRRNLLQQKDDHAIVPSPSESVPRRAA